MERVKKGEKYWSIDKYGSIQEYLECGSAMNDYHYESLIYFHTEEETRAMRDKLHAVLKGADVIEMPSEKEVMNDCNKRTKHLKKINPHCYLFMNGNTLSAYEDGWRDCQEKLRSKIVK